MKAYSVFPLAIVLCTSFFILNVAACGGMAQEEVAQTGTQSSALMNTNGFVKGGKCTVTEGDSKGKKGTYDEDGWCCVDGGLTCVECDNPNGKRRCKDGHKVFISPQLPVLQPSGQVIGF